MTSLKGQQDSRLAVDLLTEHLELTHRSQQAYLTRETLRGVTFFELCQKLSCRAEQGADLPDSVKQTKNRAPLLLATFQCRLAFMLNPAEPPINHEARMCRGTVYQC